MSGTEEKLEESVGEESEEAATETGESEEASVEATATGEDGNEAEAEEGDAAESIEAKYPDHNWYVVHTYSNFEYRAKAALEERIRRDGLDSLISRVVIPEETVVELVKGQRKTSKRKFFPGYMLVRMEMNEKAWHTVCDTPKVTGFVGDRHNPVPVSEDEINRMTNKISEGTAKPKPKVSFKEGETVRVIDGPFLNFNGTVENVNMDKAKVKVLVSIFGRSTPVELDFVQVEKI